MNLLAEGRKALVALAIAAGGGLVTALGPQSPGADTVTGTEWLLVLGLGLVAAGSVWVTPNKTSPAQRARILAEQRAAEAGPWAAPTEGPWTASRPPREPRHRNRPE
ncbi:hypothetical protein [Planomonospora sp. ID82291]|uniref:hypothetical protein n=1 Tax=Planomonospora sp. ID82291 TaxID=2738136 RepID=UPI0018C38870|nr:hypothetical protein [Planomonospora sp. ID82291]MBG0819150.1 hypothetical protein [Planomonospora sp. ID82291]